MQQNVGEADGTVRVLLGAVLGVVSLAVLAGSVPLPTLASPALGVVALVLLVTGAVNTCPLYGLLGVDTLRQRF
ncbi:DUF2892 domain-containing protein [Halobaculum sp. MBLA0147]|uniref:YgaP family membrane protein n=1 Tax=Halobaculum sp. MBLA0147 TaxID=3079934 RepID=UPI0035262403